METARQLIDALLNETREDSVSPQRLAGIYDAILSKGESDRENLEKKIAEAAASGSPDLPEDFLERVNAIGTTASSALDKAGDALGKAEQAIQSAQSAKAAASDAKTAADNAKKLADTTEEAFSSYSETTDSRLKSLEDFRALVGDVSFWAGTMQQYDSIAAKDPATIYFITE